MHDDLKGVEMQSFVRELTGHLLAVCSLPGTHISVEEQIAPLSMDIDTAVPLGLILNELFTNSCKHAFHDRTEGRVTILLKKTGEGSYFFQYSDDGSGLPAKAMFERADTLGLKLISRLSAQLSSKMRYEFKAGSIFTLVFNDFKTRNEDY